MNLPDAVAAYLAGTCTHGGDLANGETPHDQQKRIILVRMSNWLVQHRAESNLANIFPVASLASLSQFHLSAFVAFRRSQPGLMGGKLSVVTINKEITYIQMFLRYAAESPLDFRLPNGWKPPKLSRVKPKPHERRSVKRALDPVALDRVFRATEFATQPKYDGISAPEWWRALLLIAFTTSMRRRALFGCPRPSDSDLAARRLVLPAQFDKSNRERHYPLTPLACEMIRRLPCKPGEVMFRWVNRRGRPADLRSVYTVMESWQTAAGILKAEQSRLHILRRTHCTYLLEQGVDPVLVQRQLGHTDINVMMNHYAASQLIDLRRDAVDQLYVPPSLLTQPRLPPPSDPYGADAVCSD